MLISGAAVVLLFDKEDADGLEDEFQELIGRDVPLDGKMVCW